MPCYCMHAAPACHCLLSSPRQPAADHTPEAPSSTHQGRGAGPAPYRISKLPCLHLSIHGATHTIVNIQTSWRMVGWLAQSKNCLEKVPKRFLTAQAFASHAPDTTGLPKVFVWEASKNFRVEGALDGPGRQV
eukprot:1156326-Pelagomonas_calceolata.AAC.7